MQALRIIAVLSLVCLVNIAAAQVDVVTQTIDGKPHYVHRVEPGHTLYAIARLYKVDIEDILRQNPGAADGLQIGQTLTIAVPEEANMDKWENPIDIRDGLLIHKVNRGETLFAIARQYKVDINDILDQNPGVADGLRKGQELRIPFNDVDEADITLPDPEMAVIPAGPDSLLTHEVIPGQTLYGISKQYSVEIGELEALNPDLVQGLKAGQLLRLPLPNPDFNKTTTEEATLPDTQTTWENLKESVLLGGNPMKDSYSISMLLPFHVQGVDTAMLSRKERALQDIALQMYRGASMAMDSLALRGLNARVGVYDVQGTEAQLNGVLKDQALRRSDVVIGPLQRSAMEAVAEDLGARGAHLVCPVPQSNIILLSHPNLSKTVASSLSQMEAMGAYIARAHQDANVVVLNSKDTRDVRNVLFFQNAYHAAVANFPAAVTQQLVELNPSGRTAGAVSSALRPGIPNVVVAPIQDKSVLQDLLTKLGLTDDIEITLYGMETWLGYDLIDIEYKERFHITVPSAAYVDYTREDVQAFAAAYRKAFDTDPGKYAFAGYDTALYYGTGLLQHGTLFSARFGMWETLGLLSTGYDFRKTGVESGFENTYCVMLRHDEYQLKPLSIDVDQP